jgi:formylglycine-generating enzyme required for sulfatase activity
LHAPYHRSRLQERPVQKRVRIAAAAFLMGSADGGENERPLHRVRLDAFEIGACQVTNAEYAAFVDATGHPPPPLWRDPDFGDPAQPVVAVSWLDAVAYCAWQSRVTGRAIRLSTEAEWECAARGGIEEARYPWGDEPPQSRPDYAQRWLRGPEPVGQQHPNVFGLYDVCENVHEWCSDWYAADFYAHAPAHNPRGPDTGTRRVSRGGSWRHQIKISRCAARSSLPPDLRYADYGFRIACDAD